jgi:hypothetical protein
VGAPPSRAPARAPGGSATSATARRDRWGGRSGRAHAAATSRTAVVVGRVAVGLIVLQTLVRGWSCLRGWFYLDDIAFYGRSMDFPVWSPTYLGLPYNNHVMPGGYVWAWVTTHLFPLDFWPIAVVMIALQLVLSVLTYRLLVELFGRHPGILAPLVVALFSPVNLPAFLWWAAAVNQLPQQLAMVASLLALVRYFRTGRTRYVVLGPLALVGGLLFSEKSLLLLPLLVGVTLAFFTTGSLWRRVLQTLRRHRWVWGSYAVVAVCYLAYYVLNVPSPIQPASAGHDIADLTTQSIFRGALPGLLGGPWQWVRIGAAGARADPNAFLVVMTFVVVTAVVAASIVMWRGATRAWLVLLAYAGLNLALLARSRATFIGPVIGTEYRYQTDVALVAAIALALATVRMVGAFPRADADPLQPRVPARAWLTENVLEPMRAAGAAPATSSGVVQLVAGTGAGLLLASSLYSTWRYDPLWVDNPARPYMQTVRAELATMPEGTVLADSQVPDEVAWPLLFPYNRTYRLFAPVLTKGQRLASGHATAALVVPDQHGILRRALVAGPTAPPGPEQGCGWVLGPTKVTIPLRATATDEVAVIRIGYGASAATTLTVRVNGEPMKADVHRGIGTLFLAVPGPVSSITVDPTGDNARVCTDDIAAGVPVAAPASAP